MSINIISFNCILFFLSQIIKKLLFKVYLRVLIWRLSTIHLWSHHLTCSPKFAGIYIQFARGPWHIRIGLMGQNQLKVVDPKIGQTLDFHNLHQKSAYTWVWTYFLFFNWIRQRVIRDDHSQWWSKRKREWMILQLRKGWTPQHKIKQCGNTYKD